MKFFSLLFLLATTGCLTAQSPVVKMLAYSRGTYSGIPSGPGTSNNPFPVKYLIYVVVKKGTPIFVDSVCLKGQVYSATLQKVSSPVVVPHDVNVPSASTDTLVPKTPDDVYRVDVEEQKGPACVDRAKELAQENEAVISLKSGNAMLYASTKTIVALPAAAAP